MKVKITLLLIGLGLLITGCWPSIVSAYFPANLPFVAIGGGLTGWYGASILSGK